MYLHPPGNPNYYILSHMPITTKFTSEKLQVQLQNEQIPDPKLIVPWF